MILITGHKGMIGKRLFKKFGSQAMGVDFTEGKNLLTCKLPLGFSLECIYHLAAQTSVEESWNDPVHDLDNIRLTARLVDKYPDVKIVYTNSAASRFPIRSPYGFSKRACAEYLQLFHKNYVSCVLPNIYGEEGGKSVVDIFKDKESVAIYGDGLQTRDYVHVDDIVDGLVKAKEWPTGEYEMGSGKATSVLQLAEGKKIEFRPARDEARESVLRNTTPDWGPTIKVTNYLHD